MEKEYYSALTQCCKRYYLMAVSSENKELYEFITNEFFYGIRDRIPLMKLNRWLGYIQGQLIAEDLTTVQAERDWTRPLFRPLDFPNGT